MIPYSLESEHKHINVMLMGKCPKKNRMKKGVSPIPNNFHNEEVVP